MKTIDNKTKLVKKFHAVCEVSSTSKAMQTRILTSYGVADVEDLPEEKLEKVIIELQRIPDMWRKRVMASIGGWLFASKKEQGLEIIKGIACRATHYDDFNKIPVSRLRDLYNEFLHKQTVSYASSAIKKLVVYKTISSN